MLLVDAGTGGSLLTGAGTTAGALAGVVGLLASVLGLGLALPALVALGVGYVRAGRTPLGCALVAGPVLSVLFFVGGWHADYAAVGALPAVVPTAATFVAVGHELWTRPGAVAGDGAGVRDRQDEA